MGEERKMNFDLNMVERWLNHRAEEDLGISLFKTLFGHCQAVTWHKMLCLPASVSLPVKKKHITPTSCVFVCVEIKKEKTKHN